MRVEVVKGFLPKSECRFLVEWAMLGVKSGWLSTGVSRGAPTNDRFTSRMYGDRFTTPPEILAISERVRAFCGISEYPLIDGPSHGRDGIVVSYTKPGGDVYKHRDPTAEDGTPTLRCNIMAQSHESGGALFVDGQQVDVGVGDLHCYLVSEHYHQVTPTGGNTPRIMYMFGAHVPAEDWNSGKIKVGLN